MLLNRYTQNIPINESNIANVMYGPSVKENGPFISADEIHQKTSILGNRNYNTRRPGVNYKSFGEKITLN